MRLFWHLQVTHYRKLFSLYSGNLKVHIVQYLNCSNYASFSPWDRGKIGIKLGTKHIVYLKLASFTSNKDVHVNRYVYFTEQNLMQSGIPLNWILKVLKWNKPKDRPQRVDGKNGVICLVIMFTSIKCQKWLFCLFLPDNSKKLVTVWAISLSKRGRSHLFLAEDGMFNRLWTLLFVSYYGKK